MPGGVCGKTSETANLQDELLSELIGLARASGGTEPAGAANGIMADSLFITLTNVSFDGAAIKNQIEAVRAEKRRLYGGGSGSDASCPVCAPYDMANIWEDNEDIRSLKSTLLFGLKGMSAYAHHAAVLEKSDETVNNFFYKALLALGEDKTADELFELLMELGGVNLRCMAMLDEANTSSFGDPAPKKVTLSVEKGPFIVVSGHELRDIKALLEQTGGKGVNIYTHCEALPAHGYPELKKYPHLKGNFGTAWQNQRKEFDNIPAPVLFTTNCLMPPKASYADRVYTTSVVSYPGVKHIEADENGNKDFSEIIERAINLRGYDSDMRFCGINGGESVTTGFGRKSILDNAPAIIEAVKSGAIKHFFLVGGCDGNKPGRNYYTEFVKSAPEDTVILTLACGKFRFNDMDLGEIGGFPRILDMGQCNDAYGAVQVAVALAEAFDCGVNDLPLTLVLSWYEQKAVCILLTLLSLGIRNIYIGPSIPAFFSDLVLNMLVNKFNLTPISVPQQDLAKILSLDVSQA